MTDLEKYGEKKWDDHREVQEKMTPKEEIEMLLKRALRDSKLGYNVAARNCIDLALELLGEIDEN